MGGRTGPYTASSLALAAIAGVAECSSACTVREMVASGHRKVTKKRLLDAADFKRDNHTALVVRFK